MARRYRAGVAGRARGMWILAGLAEVLAVKCDHVGWTVVDLGPAPGRA